MTPVVPIVFHFALMHHCVSVLTAILSHQKLQRTIVYQVLCDKCGGGEFQRHRGALT